jgi:DNA-3-methyladenine glycosylase II
MLAMTATRSFEITPLGDFSLAEANAFGFGGRGAEAGARMRLAFASDDDYAPAGVELEQSADGVVHGRVHGVADLDAVVAQTARVLSLDHDGAAWEQVLAREEPLARLAAQVPGLRPVLFHSPYEGAAWAIISSRIHRSVAAKLRTEIAATLGYTYTLHGEPMHAFPSPERLLEGLDRTPLSDIKRERLAGVAEAALDGVLDVDEIQRLGPEAATAHVQCIQGVGPFWASLIVIRASGFADAPAREPRARAKALAAYGRLETASDAEFTAITDAWRPFRTWATVLCRVARERGLK